MKTKIVLIITLLSLLYIEGFPQNISTNNLESSFTAASLSGSDVGPYEVRAIQKVNDFYNYLTIICSPEYDMKLRKF